MGRPCLRCERAKLALQDALAALAARHETLRTRFVERDGQFLQAVLPSSDPAAAPALVTRRPTACGDAQELSELVAGASTQPYRLLDGSVPLRAVLVPGGLRGRDLLLMCMHHILRCGMQSEANKSSRACISGQGRSPWGPCVDHCGCAICAALHGQVGVINKLTRFD